MCTGLRVTMAIALAIGIAIAGFNAIARNAAKHGNATDARITAIDNSEAN